MSIINYVLITSLMKYINCKIDVIKCLIIVENILLLLYYYVQFLYRDF